MSTVRSGAAGDVPARERVGRFRVEGVLGGGGMGIVYRARAEDGTPAAVKVIRLGVEEDVEARRRFERESRIRVEHPNVVRILDAGIDERDRAPFIAFELLEGENLAERFGRGRLDAAEVVRVGTQVARGLAAVHAHGVVHRDLKPANVFLCRDGTVKLLDFGIARAAARETRLTRTGLVLGTPAYVSPEQARGEVDVDPRTDVWSLGAVLYEACAGRPPFDRDTLLATMLAVVMEEPVPLVVAAPWTPHELGLAVERCLAKTRERRWPDAAALERALATADLTVPEGARLSSSPTLQQPSVTPVRRPIAPGEQRLVVVLMAEGVRDARALEQAIAASGGAPIALAGARTIGLFGGESWEGDEMDRAVRAAIQVRAAVERVAVASGRATGGAAGVAGAALRIAERACAAGLDGVAVDAVTARALRDTTSLDLRGAGEGLFEIASRGSAAGTVPPPAAFPAVRTLGRDAELATMSGALTRVLDEGAARAVLVLGPPGIGKTRLRWEMERIVDETGGVRVLTGRSEPLRQESAYALMASVLERQLPALGDPDSTWLEIRSVLCSVADERTAGEHALFLADLVGARVGETAPLRAARRDPRLMADRLRLALQDWFGGLCAQGPVALLLEDLHWADAASLDVIEDVLDREQASRLLVFATARPELLERRADFLASPSAERLEPRGLGLADVSRIAASIAGMRLPKPLLEALAERTAGNPLFVEQIVLALRDEQRLGRRDPDATDSMDEWPLPIDVEAAIQSRLDHLPLAEKELCKRAAVWSRPFSVEEIAALGVARAEPLLASLGRRDLIVRRARAAREYQFRTRLVADVAYGMVAEGLRLELHRRAAQHLESQPAPDAEELAIHHDRGGAPADAARWYAKAALAARTHGDGRTVLRCATRALDLAAEVVAKGAEPLPTFELQTARSEAQELLGDFAAQESALDGALAAARTDAERARVLTDRAVWLFRRGDATRALEVADEAVSAAERSRDDEARAMAHGRRSVLLTYAGRVDEAEAALRAAERDGEGLVPVRALAAVWRAQLASARGDLGQRRDAYRRAVELYAELGDVWRGAGAEMNLADASNRVGAYAEAEAALRKVASACHRVGHRWMEGYALANLGYALTMRGAAGEALAVLTEARRIAERTGEARLGAWIAIYRSRAALAVGRADEARADATEAAAAVERLGIGAMRVLALTRLAAAALALGDVGGALDASAEALALRDELGSVEEDESEVFLTRAEALESAGRGPAAEEVRVLGRSRIHYIARRIADPEWRRRFMEDVPSNRALLGDASAEAAGT